MVFRGCRPISSCRAALSFSHPHHSCKKRAHKYTVHATKPNKPSNIHHSHLLEKIRKASSNANKQNPVELDGRVVPQPIKRSLLV